jgi:hypothetical protein
MPGRSFVRVIFCTLSLTVLAAHTGCATKFVAKRANPLKPPGTPAWDPGELSASTVGLLDRLRLPGGWKRDPRAALAALDPLAARDIAARRAAIEIALQAGVRAHAKFLSDRGASAFYLYAAEHAFDGVKQGDAAFSAFCTKAARYAVARLAGLRGIAEENNVHLSTTVAGPARRYRVSLDTSAPGSVRLGTFSKVWPTDRFVVAAAPVPATVEGVGTPLVGKVQGLRGAAAAEQFVPDDGLWVPLTATVRFGPRAATRQVIFTIYDRRKVETVSNGSRRETLAGDFSTPFAVRTRELNRQNFFTLGILGFLRGDRYFDSTGLYPVEFPRTDKIPVVFVHGLISDPNDWRFLHNVLLADPVIREHYQFWAFYYPTSMSVPWSAMLLREGLANARRKTNPSGRNPKLGQVVLIGHSMGGLLSRMQIVSSNERFYGSYFTKPLDQLRLTPGDREKMRKVFSFGANADVDEVIFICTPHRGSGLATNWIGKIGRSLARLPLTVLETTTNVLTLNADALVATTRLRPGTSIDSLSPNGQFVRALETMEMNPQVRKHSIIGNRGSRGALAKSSDGVVPYWSSHLPGVPETIIPSGHGSLEQEQCAAKVRDLLLKKLGEQFPHR